MLLILSYAKGIPQMRSSLVFEYVPPVNKFTFTFLSESKIVSCTVIKYYLYPQRYEIMSKTRKEYYTSEVLECKKRYCNNLPEKQRRHFLGQEYLQLGKGSQHYLSRVFGCSRVTILKGKKEVSKPNFSPEYNFQRKKGGGAKKKKKSLNN